MSAGPRPRPHPHRPRRPAPARAGRGRPAFGARPSEIYQIPLYEVDARTGMIILYDEDGRRAGSIPDLRLPHRGRPRIVADYVGQTVRGAAVREAEHDEDKPWADLIAGRIQVIDQGLWDQEARDDAEIRAIHLLKPRYNYDHNLGNPNRIEIWRQVEQRHARDRAAGRPLWIPLTQRTAAAPAEAELDVVRAGLDGREPRYPAELAWAAMVACGRFLRDLPRPVRGALALAAVVSGLWWAAYAALAGAGVPMPYAAALPGVALLACLMVLARLWMRRRARRARRRRRA